MLFEEDRVQSQCRVQAGFIITERQQCLPAAGLNARHHDTNERIVAGTVQHGLPVGIESSNIQVTMAVNQFHHHIVCACPIKHSRFLVCFQA